MEVSRIIAEIDAQISKLQQARALLAGASQPARKGPGRPKGTANATAKRKRKLSPEGRKRIARCHEEAMGLAQKAERQRVTLHKI